MAPKRYAATKQELSRALGISGWTLNSYWKRPDRPQDHSDGVARYDIRAYGNWIGSFKSAHNFGNGHNGNSGYPINPREQTLIKKNEIEIERETFKLDVERGKYALKTVVTEQVRTHIGTLFRELDKAFKHELPPRVEGLSAHTATLLASGKALVAGGYTGISFLRSAELYDPAVGN